MNWTQFLIGITAIYGIYYALNLLFDLFIGRRAPVKIDDGNELVFSDDSLPEAVVPNPPIAEREPMAGTENPVISSGPLQSTGGVNLKTLLSLAQNDVIEFTKAIPY
ncbi:hypothetical protein [Sphingobacterium arenae]|uniref:Uncharacterized protein n=1 Tax=Sphingobacterium arenae TaxID=1280598 RepID=A0ABR7XYB9_9SPHI|nr:hypothetical protein [Sphingobacterium arenae]MBD1424046.1 hypothetical protein [Sphingobacterium arenae]